LDPGPVRGPAPNKAHRAARVTTETTPGTATVVGVARARFPGKKFHPTSPGRISQPLHAAWGRLGPGRGPRPGGPGPDHAGIRDRKGADAEEKAGLGGERGLAMDNSAFPKGDQRTFCHISHAFVVPGGTRPGNPILPRALLRNGPGMGPDRPLPKTMERPGVAYGVSPARFSAGGTTFAGRQFALPPLPPAFPSPPI